MATRKNSFVYFGDAEVSRTSKLYKVILDEYDEITIFLNEDKVNPIATATNMDENLIAILLASIESVRRSKAKNVGNPPRKLEDEVVAEGLKCLLKVISIDELIIKVKSMKWHEIKEVLTSENPAERLDEI